MGKTRGEVGPESEPKSKPNAADKPLSAEEQTASDARKQLSEAYRRLAWDNIRHKPVWKRQDDNNDKPAAVDGLVSASTVILPGKLKPGWYDVTFVREDSDEQDREKQADAYKTFTNWARRGVPAKMTLYVDEKNNIGPGTKPGEAWPSMDKDPKKFRDTWRQVIRGYTAGLGVDRLTLSYPNAKWHEINLNNVREMMRLAKQEKAVIDIDPNVERRLANPKNKKERAMSDEIRRLMRECQEEKAKNDSALSNKRAEFAHPVNADKLNTNAKALNEKTDALKAEAAKAAPEDLAGKIKQVDAERKKVSESLDKITQDMKVSKPGPEICDKYTKVLATAANSVKASNAVLQEVAAKAADVSGYEQLVRDMKSLDGKVKEVSKNVGLNSQLAEQRIPAKIDDLRDQGTKLNTAVKELQKAQPAEKDDKMKAVESAMAGMKDAAADMKGEASKPDASSQLPIIRNALADAEKAVDTAKVGIGEFYSSNTDFGDRCEAVAHEADEVILRLRDADAVALHRSNPIAAAEGDVKQQIEAIKAEENPNDQAKSITEALNEVAVEATAVKDKIVDLNKAIDKMSQASPEELEQLLATQAELAQQQKALAAREQGLNKLASEVAGELKADVGAAVSNKQMVAIKLEGVLIDATNPTEAKKDGTSLTLPPEVKQQLSEMIGKGYKWVIISGAEGADVRDFLAKELGNAMVENITVVKDAQGVKDEAAKDTSIEKVHLVDSDQKSVADFNAHGGKFSATEAKFEDRGNKEPTQAIGKIELPPRQEITMDQLKAALESAAAKSKDTVSTCGQQVERAKSRIDDIPQEGRGITL